MLRMLGKAERAKLAQTFSGQRPTTYAAALKAANECLTDATLLSHSGG
jgi:hypothetical protein